MIAFPHCKINLGLHIFDKRPDGYHNIETVFVPVPWQDMLEVIKTPEQAEKVTFMSEGLKIDGQASDNLVVKAYRVLDKDFDLSPVTFFLYKKLPMGAGLGGGSSNAAFALQLLNRVFELKLSTEQLRTYALQLGSDCAFFIGNEICHAAGRGELLKPLNFNLPCRHILIVKAPVHINTGMAYAHTHKRGAKADDDSLKTLLKMPVETWKENIKNDFESWVFREYPELADIKKKLYNLGAIYASLSGSGASVYGLFNTKPVTLTWPDSYTVFDGKI